MSSQTNHIGKSANRVDGPLKVSGAAKYSAEFAVPDLNYGVVVSSPIARGRILGFPNLEQVLALPGVRQVFTHENVPRQAWFDRAYKDDIAPGGSPFRPLQSDKVMFSQQPVALVVADTFELARYVSSILQVEYKEEKHETDIESQRDKGHPPGKGKSGYKPPSSRGNADKALRKAEHRIRHEYIHGTQHHNPMELYACTVHYHPDGRLTIYDKTQGVLNCQQYVTKVFGLGKEQARVINLFNGGAFGSGLRPQYELFMSVMAALELQCSVRVTLTRQQMFSIGHRPHSLQTVELGTNADGTLAGLKHYCLHETSRFEEYTENVVNWSGMLYQCDHVTLSNQVAPLDVYTPQDMRAPGAATGLFALEVAMDEMAYAAGLDPLDFRLRNYAERDQSENLPFSSKRLRECYRQGAEKFGWDGRPLQPRSMRQGRKLVGWGMAGGVWDAQMQKAAAKASISADGQLTVTSAAGENGTGTYTIMTQIAAETLGLPLEAVSFQLGDTNMPAAPVQGGSWTAASVGTAVQQACLAVGEKLLKLAKKMDDSPLKGAELEDVEFVNGLIRLRQAPEQSVVLRDVLQTSGERQIEADSTALPNLLNMARYSMHSHNAVFAEVEVDEELGTIHVTRVVNALAIGRVLNPKTARSQVLGSVVWGISMALMEETVTDHRFGRYMNHNLSEYHVPTNADVRDIEVIFVEEEDPHLNPLGVKGVGELGLLGVAAAINNAVFHATGKRVRDLPIYIDKLL